MQLIPFTQEHFHILPSWFDSEADIVQWGGPFVHFPLDEPQMQTMLNEGLHTPPLRLCWMAQHDDQFAGHAQLGFDWRNGNATLGRVAINPTNRGEGLSVPMLRLVMEQAFSFKKITRLELNVYTFNEPAIVTYNKLGFILEGIRRSSTLVGNKRWDTAMMAVLRDEFLSG